MDTYTQPVPTKRQYRSLEEKQRIVGEALTEGASVARVARAHGVNANLVFNWCRLYRAGRLRRRSGALAAVAGVATQFVTHHLAISRDKGNVKRERLESFVKAMFEIGIESKAGLSLANRCRWFADEDDKRDWPPSPQRFSPAQFGPYNKTDSSTKRKVCKLPERVDSWPKDAGRTMTVA
jgi:transposase-like protein